MQNDLLIVYKFVLSVAYAFNMLISKFQIVISPNKKRNPRSGFLFLYRFS